MEQHIRSLNEKQMLLASILFLAILGGGFLVTNPSQTQKVTGNSINYCERLQPTVTANCDVNQTEARSVRSCEVQVQAVQDDAQFMLYAEGPESHYFGQLGAGESARIERNASLFSALFVIPVNPNTNERCEAATLVRPFS